MTDPALSASTIPDVLQHDRLATAPTATAETARKAGLAALVGTAMEWYDFFLFTTASALIFGSQYFISGSATTGLLYSFGTMAVGFVARPVGGLIFGHLGDRLGRRPVMLVTIVGIGVATGLIGVLPNFMSIGYWAPILLIVLRVCQGLSAGGEWGGAITAAVEAAPPEKRARFASFPQIGSPIGTLLSSGGFFLVSWLMGQGTFTAWGWRIPFLVAIPLLLVGLYVRRQMEESPAFRQLESQGRKESAPIVQALRRSWRQILAGFAANFVGVGGFFVVTTFAISYGTGTLGLPSTLMLGATLCAAAFEILIIMFFGRLGERIGSARVSLIGGIATVVVALPVFALIESRHPALVIVAITVGVACLSIPYAVNGSLLASLFPPEHRLSGVSICANISAIISGFLPMIATALTAGAGGSWLPAAVMLMVIGAITAVGSALAPRLTTPEEGYRV